MAMRLEGTEDGRPCLLNSPRLIGCRDWSGEHVDCRESHETARIFTAVWNGLRIGLSKEILEETRIFGGLR